MPQSPVHSPAPYVNYVRISPDRSEAKSELLIGEALAGFGRTVSQIAVEQREADAKRRRLSGQAAALQQGAPEDWGAFREATLADPTKGREYLNAYSRQAAKVAAAAQSVSLQDQFAQRTDIDNEQAFNKWFTENTTRDLDTFASLDDPETTLAYAGKLEETELTLRAAVKERAANKAYTETETNFNMVVQQEIEDAVGRNVRGTELLDILVQQRRDGESVLLKSADINEAQIRAVGELAASEGRPELLNIFEYSRPDATDPEKKIPGLAFAKEHGAQIEKYRNAATREHDARVSEQLKKTTYEAEKRAQDLLENGDTAQLEVFADLMVEQGVFTPSTAASYYKAAHKVDEKAARIHRNLNNIITGNTDAIPAHRRVETMDAYYDRMIEKANAVGTPEAYHVATKDILTTSASVGALPKALHDKMQTLNVVNPETFASTIQLAGVMEAVAPSLYYDNVPDEVRMQIDQAVRLNETYGDQGQAMALMQEMRKPENVERRKQLAGDAKVRANRLEKIRQSIGLDSDNRNAVETSQWVSDVALDYMIQTGTDDYSAALSYAKKQYKASFTEVKLGGGAGYVSVYKGRLGLPDNIEDQFQWFTESYTKEQREATPGLPDDLSFYLVPDAASKTQSEREFLVKDSLGRMTMEVRDGLAVPVRIGQRELEMGFYKGKAAEAEDVQAKQQVERARRDSRVLRNRRFYPANGDVLRERYRNYKERPKMLEGPPDISPDAPANAPAPTSSLTPPLQEAASIVAQYEQFRDKAYAATEAEEARGIWTVGYGVTEGITRDSSMSKEQAKDALAAQLQKTADVLADEVGPYWNQLSDGQQAVVISLAYNVDKDVVGQLKRSKALRALKRGDLETFKHEAFDSKVGFVKQRQKDGTKKVVRGLVNRRRDELKKFNEASGVDVASNL